MSIFLLSHLNAHILLSQTLILPCHSTAAQSSHFWHQQPHCRQQSCQHKETWESNPPDVYSKGFHGQDFHGELFSGEVSLQTSTPAAREPGPLHLHTHISINLIWVRKGGLLCAASLCHPLSFFSLHTPPRGLQAVRQKCHLWLCPC